MNSDDPEQGIGGAFRGSALGQALGGLIVNLPGGIGYWSRRHTAAIAALPRAPSFGPDDRVLVVAPHPDDEALACGGAVLEALRAGASVWLVWLTCGDGFWLDATLLARHARPHWRDMLLLGAQRIEEAHKAARVLGVPDAQLLFLGYPDRGLTALLKTPNGDKPFQSFYTGQTCVPYPEAISPGAAHTAANLKADLETVLKRSRPTVVLAPSSRDAHPDHRATAGLVNQLLEAMPSVRRYEWIIHGGIEWPLPKGVHPNLPLAPPPRGRGLPWERFEITPDQVEVKLHAIACHHSQVLLMSRYLASFARSNELFARVQLPSSLELQRVEGHAH